MPSGHVLNTLNNRIRGEYWGALSSSNGDYDEYDTKEKFSVVIGKGSTLNLEGDGTLTFSESLLVEGTLIGRLRCLQSSSDAEFLLENLQRHETKVKIGPEGELQADIHCVKNVEVQGLLKGNVCCHSLVVSKGASVIGDIMAEEIQVEAGASLIGSIVTGIFTREQTAVLDDFHHKQPNGFEITKKYHKEQESFHNDLDPDDAYGNIVEEVSIQKSTETSWMGVILQKNEKLPPKQNFDISTIDWVDDFGREFITLDPTNGRYVDSFGHPLIRGADDDQVASFRELRNLSKATWTMINTHRKEKERKEILQRSTGSRKPSLENAAKNHLPQPLPSSLKMDRDNIGKDDGDGDDDDVIPSFLQHS